MRDVGSSLRRNPAGWSREAGVDVYRARRRARERPLRRQTQRGVEIYRAGGVKRLHSPILSPSWVSKARQELRRLDRERPSRDAVRARRVYEPGVLHLTY